MARKFGKKTEISLNPLDYSIYLMGEGGIGKTTLVKQVCEKMVGDDGYIFLTCGKEADQATIEGIVQEAVWDWEHFDEVTMDIIENRFTDYSDLKVVVIDTIDELMRMAEDETIRIWNRENPDKRTKSFKATFSGFNGPTDKATELVTNRLWELKRVGISPIIIGHTKKTDITDPVTLASYSMLSTNMDKRYFNALKNKVDVVGVAYVDRDIDKVKTGRKNVVNGKEEIIGKVKSERRVICFRDDNFSVDSKSRFADIVDRIPLDADEFIKALTDAIKAEHDKGGRSYEADLKKQASEKKRVESVQAERVKQYVGAAQDEEDEQYRAEWISAIQNNYKNASDDVKAKVAEVRNNIGKKFSDPEFPIAELKKVYSLVV